LKIVYHGIGIQSKNLLQQSWFGFEINLTAQRGD